MKPKPHQLDLRPWQYQHQFQPRWLRHFGNSCRRPCPGRVRSCMQTMSMSADAFWEHHKRSIVLFNQTYSLCSSAPNLLTKSLKDILDFLYTREHRLQVLNFFQSKPSRFHGKLPRMTQLRTKAWPAFHDLQMPHWFHPRRSLGAGAILVVLVVWLF